MGNSVSRCEEAALPPTAPEPIEVEAETEQVAAEEEPQVVEEEAPAQKDIILETAALDARFPSTNQARHCFVKYNEAHKCWKEKGEGAPECARLARDYRALCPTEWLERYNEARESGTWWGKF